MSNSPIDGNHSTGFDRSSPWAVNSIVILAVTLVFTIGLFIYVLYWTPHFLKMFKDLGGRLPVLTQFCLSPEFLADLIYLTVLGIGKEFVVRNSKIRLVLSVVHLLLLLAMREVYVVGMFQPLINLMRTMEEQ